MSIKTMVPDYLGNGITEKELLEIVYIQYESGVSWMNISTNLCIPLKELLERPELKELYYK